MTFLVGAQVRAARSQLCPLQCCAREKGLLLGKVGLILFCSVKPHLLTWIYIVLEVIHPYQEHEIKIKGKPPLKSHLKSSNEARGSTVAVAVALGVARWALREPTANAISG